MGGFCGFARFLRPKFSVGNRHRSSVEEKQVFICASCTVPGRTNSGSSAKIRDHLATAYAPPDSLVWIIPFQLKNDLTAAPLRRKRLGGSLHHNCSQGERERGNVPTCSNDVETSCSFSYSNAVDTIAKTRMGTPYAGVVSHETAVNWVARVYLAGMTGNMQACSLGKNSRLYGIMTVETQPSIGHPSKNDSKLLALRLRRFNFTDRPSESVRMPNRRSGNAASSCGNQIQSEQCCKWLRLDPIWMAPMQSFTRRTAWNCPLRTGQCSSEHDG